MKPGVNERHDPHQGAVILFFVAMAAGLLTSALLIDSLELLLVCILGGGLYLMVLLLFYVACRNVGFLFAFGSGYLTGMMMPLVCDIAFSVGDRLIYGTPMPLQFPLMAAIVAAFCIVIALMAAACWWRDYCQRHIDADAS